MGYICIMKPKMQVLIAAFGPEGAERIARCKHPRVEGVEYIISLQLPEGPTALPAELNRPDFKVFTINSIGVAVNRNNALRHATAPILLMADDDVTYTCTQLQNVITAFKTHPECDILTFAYDSASAPYTFPDTEFILTVPTPISFGGPTIALRRGKMPGRLKFNENFGPGAEFIAGEDEMFLYDALRMGMRGRFIPIRIFTHNHPSTGHRMAHDPRFIRSKGAFFVYLHPYSWPLRLLTHAWRNYKQKTPLGTADYINSWLSGAFKYIRLKHTHRP